MADPKGMTVRDPAPWRIAMRTLALFLGLAALGVTLGACRQVCSTWDSAKCRVNVS